MFKDYLQSIAESDAATLKKHVIDVVHELAPEAVEGLSYGLPAFIFKERPLVGFSSNKYGLNIYPYDPSIIRQVVEEFPELDHSKGVIRFSPENPIPKDAVRLMAGLRLEKLK